MIIQGFIVTKENNGYWKYIYGQNVKIKIIYDTL